jgi:hypothetical protein
MLMLNNFNNYLEWLKTEEGQKFLNVWKRSNNNGNINKDEIRNRNNYLLN